jgi:hypothetical protein
VPAATGQGSVAAEGDADEKAKLAPPFMLPLTLSVGRLKVATLSVVAADVMTGPPSGVTRQRYCRPCAATASGATVKLEAFAPAMLLKVVEPTDIFCHRKDTESAVENTPTKSVVVAPGKPVKEAAGCAVMVVTCAVAGGVAGGAVAPVAALPPPAAADADAGARPPPAGGSSARMT